jgi:hypothetical protein
MKIGVLLGAAALACAVAATRPATRWDLMILDGAPEGVTDLAAFAAGDLDGDGRMEIITGGTGGLLWYHSGTPGRGRIASGTFGVGLALEDIDGDGVKEVVCGYVTSKKPEKWEIGWYRPARDWREPWAHGIIDSNAAGQPHDILFADLDGDHKRELIADAMYSATPGLFIYRRTADGWQKATVQNRYSAEGTDAGDLDGDGRVDIISGPYWFKAPSAGPFAGTWEKRDLAPGFREMCRAALLDINGDGRLDAVVAESEFPDGRMSWFENTRSGLVEHPMERPLNFAHSMRAWRDAAGAHVFVAEMAKGGWDAPYNHNARLLRFDFAADGKTWQRHLLYQGQGTHQATMVDIDGDGRLEVVGKTWQSPVIQIWKERAASPFPNGFNHRFLDREKPFTCTDVTAADVDGDGRKDVLCGQWWYRNPDWERFEIPGIYQAINAYDLDGDGRVEIVATKKKSGVRAGDFYPGLTSDLCWLKAIDPRKGRWEEHAIGTGNGDWPHGNLIAPLLPGGKLALVTGYHSAQLRQDRPELFEVPSNPASGPWPKRVLADVPYGEQMVAADLDGDGDLDIAAGPYWLENRNGSFLPHQIAEGFEIARVAVLDVNVDGRPDIAIGEEQLSYETKQSFFARVAWFENQGGGKFAEHVIDRIVCPHSLGVADLDGDGKPELVAGEHDPFKPYRSGGRLFVYKPADAAGLAWYRYVIDEGFEHHDGAIPIELAPGRIGIVSHGWRESLYLHLWEPAK